MCGTCGCAENGHAHTETVPMEHRVLARNDHLAEHNRTWLRERSILMVNLMSSPGAGKTTLLERTIAQPRDRVPVAVIEGDQATPLDADRIRATGCPALQVNTGSGCHLDAEMIARAVRELDPAPHSVLFVENVGNLVCPALFDLGEDHRAVVMSVTEGEDKPLKYPYMFRTADVVLLNKVDLLPHVDFDPVRFRDRLGQVNPGAGVLPVSALRGDGLDEWHTWLADRLRRLTAEAGIPR
jgi:hydrogenase nickel incorporation protein HypB